MEADCQVVQSGDLVAIVGDSITEQKLYSVFIEDYLLMCSGVSNVRTMQFGWNGDTTWGFLDNKLQNDVLRYSPNVMTMCFGMNDGGYRQLKPEVADRYRRASQDIISAAKKGGVRGFILGSPGAVDSITYASGGSKRSGGSEAAAIYNQTLASLCAIDKELAEKNNVVFADVHTRMMDVMSKAESRYGAQYHLAGEDGVHPEANGHLVMAYAFLKAMGFDGSIGSITIDLADHSARGSEGHKITKNNLAEGMIEIESTRYPFCFYGKPDDPGATTGIIEFFPFNEDLNRFTLVVTNASSDRLAITWGDVTKEFTKAQLTHGVNLAAEFLDNPFKEQFTKVDYAVHKQQNLETSFIKGVIWNIPGIAEYADDADKAALNRIVESGTKRARSLADAAAKFVIPIKHTLMIQELK